MFHDKDLHLCDESAEEFHSVLMKDSALRSFHRREVLERTDLRSLCIKRLATILTQNERKLLNLSCLPTSLAEELLEACIAISAPQGPLRYSHIADILTSGRLERLSLWDLEITAKDLSSIGRKTRGILQELEVNGVAVRGRRPEAVLKAISSLERLVEANVHSLKRVNLGLALGDLLILSGLRSLECLSVKFDCAYQLNQLIIRNRNREYIWPRLRSFSYGDFFSAPTKRFVCHLLQRCPLLSHIDTNIAEALEHLHAQEFHSGGGTVKKQYIRIEKAVLGSFIYGSGDVGVRIRGASVLSVQIAAACLVELHELDLYLDSHDAILVLGDFVNLERLRLMWVNKAEDGDYTRGLETLLTEVGCQLKELCLHSFVNVDVHDISSLCPYLDSLGIVECRTQCGSHAQLRSFEQLRRFRFIPPSRYPVQQTSLDLLTLLYGSENLEQFLVELRQTEDDLLKLVRDMLAVNKFKKLYMAGLYFDQAVDDYIIDGLLKLVSSWKQLRYLTVGDPALFDVIKQNCPNVSVRREYLYVGL